jgi:hypothetical protein
MVPWIDPPLVEIACAFADVDIGICMTARPTVIPSTTSAEAAFCNRKNLIELLQGFDGDW